MKEKIKEFYHKFDYKINANFLIETIIQSIIMMFIFILIALLGHKEVKAETLIARYMYSNKDSSPHDFAVKINNYYYGYNGYVPPGTKYYNLSTVDYLYTFISSENLRCTDGQYVKFSGSFVFNEYANTIMGSTNRLALSNGVIGNKECTITRNYNNHTLDFNCPPMLYESAGYSIVIYSSKQNISTSFMLKDNSSYTCMSQADVINSNQNENNDKLIDSIQGDDINTDDIPVRDDDTLNNYNKAEDDLLGDDLDIENTIKINSNKNAMTWIWDLITKILNWNEKVFSFIISVLSIGLIKLILCR